MAKIHLQVDRKTNYIYVGEIIPRLPDIISIIRQVINGQLLEKMSIAQGTSRTYLTINKWLMGFTRR